MALSEHSLQTKVIRHLMRHHAEDVFWFAIPNAGRRSMRAAAKLRAEGMLRGAPDLCVVLPHGRVGWLELKTVKGRMSDDQIGFKNRCYRLGHSYMIARTLDTCIDVLKDWGALESGKIHESQ